MTIEYIIQNIKRELIRSFAILDEWFDKDDALRSYRSPVMNKTVTEIMEHLTLTNRIILSQADKGCKEALDHADDHQLRKILDAYVFDDASLKNIDAEEYIAAMEVAAGELDHLPCNEIRSELRDQLHRSLCVLELLAKGEGVLYTSLISASALAKLDVYQHFYILALHIKRHIEHMEAIEREFYQSVAGKVS